MGRMKLGVLISGRGSNLQALIHACSDNNDPAEIALVLSNRPDAKGLERAAAAGIATQVIDHKSFDDRDAFDSALSDALSAADVALVCLAGFMRLLQESFVERWHDRVINIHPSLLPAFRGLNVHERVIQSGVRITGCSVHMVRSSVDDGPIIIQAAVPVLPQDTAHDLAARVLKAEHKIYPEAVRLIAQGRIKLHSGRVEFVDSMELGAPLINPPLGRN